MPQKIVSPARRSNKTPTPQSRNTLAKIELVLEKREQDRLDVGIAPRPVLRCGLPLKQPKPDYLVHASRDGNCSLKVKADPEFGMPFGRDLLTPLWLFSEAFAQKSRTIRFKSGRAMLRSMGLNEDGHTFKWATGSIERNFGATWEFDIEHERLGKIRRDRHYFRLVSRASLWFNKDDGQLALDGEDFLNSITLTEEAYALALHRGYQARLEMETVAALSNAPGATRLFLILRDRCAEIPEHKPYAWIPLTGPTGLDVEIGVKPYAAQEAWRQLVRKWLKEIRAFWPECPTEICKGKDGWYRLKIYPAKPA